LHRPKLLIADEATSALDLITQSEILALFKQLSNAYGISILFITHDLAAAASVCDRLAILYNGEKAESGPPEQILQRPTHPYTALLVAALPRGAGREPLLSNLDRDTHPKRGSD
jgi:peptide/nickel transport system permease protein